MGETPFERLPHRNAVAPRYIGGIEILLSPQYIGEGWGGVIQGFLQEF
ncbi:hypothetical protein [Nostoc sp.]